MRSNSSDKKESGKRIPFLFYRELLPITLNYRKYKIDPVIILVIVIAVLVLIFKFIRKRRKLSIYDFHALVVHCASKSIQSKHFDTEREKSEIISAIYAYVPFLSDAMERIDLKNL